jgi:hypothetical protein
MDENEFNKLCLSLGYLWSIELYCPDKCCKDGAYLCYIEESLDTGREDIVEASGATPSKARLQAVNLLREKRPFSTELALK